LKTLADYTPLIARAVDGLEHNTGENRRELYERARKALLAQLRGVDPPLDESEITRERLALEDAIRAVETDAGKRAREQEPEGEQGDEFPEPPEPRRSLSDQGLAGFRENVAEAEGLGDAAAQANESARRVFPPEAEQEPESEPDRPDFPPDRVEDEIPETPPPSSGWQAPPASPQYDDEEDEAYRGPRRSYGRLIAIVLGVVVLAGIAAAGYWQRDTIASLAHKAAGVVTAWRSTPAPNKPRQPAPSQQQQPKITDRVGQPNTPSAERPANAPAAEVAQKVVLYEEDPGNAQGKRYVGSAIWKTETVSPGPGLAPELAVRCDVEIPERRMRMTWSLRRNTDKALPASHTIEIMFTLPADFSEGGIQNVPGVLMKQNEQARGVPLAGLAVKVTNGFFLVGLNSSEVDVQRNIALLKERPWFDIPIVYNNNKRAILAVEKGIPGERAFADAFQAWGQ
jgi:hypothetical protein